MKDKDIKPYWGSEPEHLEEKKPLDDVAISWMWSLVKRFFRKWGENQRWVNLGIGYFVFFFIIIIGMGRMIVIETKYDFLGYLLGIGVLSFLHTIWLKEVVVKCHVEEQVEKFKQQQFQKQEEK
jgi:hypothetical protein